MKERGTELEWFITNATREPLLDAAKEIKLSRLIKAMYEVQELASSKPYCISRAEHQTIRRGMVARDRFFRANTRLVVNIAKKYQHKVKHMALSDLIQEGALGLSTAIEKFDHERGYKFSTYAYWWIRQAICRAIQMQEDIIRLPIGGQVALSKIRKWLPEFVSEHDRQPTIEEMAAYTGNSVWAIEGYIQHLNKEPRSLDAAGLNADPDSANGLHELLACERETPEQYVTQQIFQHQLQELFKHLKPEQIEVFTLRYGLDGSEPKSYRSIADITGHDRNQIHYIEKTAIKSIKFFSRHGWKVNCEVA